MTELHILSVFVSPTGTGGNPLGVFLDSNEYDQADRQKIAADLNFSETVFVEDIENGTVQIFTPVHEIPYAGHPLVGTGWLIRKIGRKLEHLQPRAGTVEIWAENENSWIRLQSDWSLGWDFQQLDSPADIDALTLDDTGLTDYWSWIDEEVGTIRSRVFVPDLGVYEDEATGSAAGELTAKLNREITIHQGVGSVIHGRPGANKTVEIGGLVELVETREY